MICTIHVTFIIYVISSTFRVAQSSLSLGIYSVLIGILGMTVQVLLSQSDFSTLEVEDDLLPAFRRRKEIYCRLFS